MDILKIALDWAKTELVSTTFFMIVGVVFMLISLGFWQYGKTDLARAYIIPILVAGVFLLIVGIGLFATNKSRITEFEIDHKKDAAVFVQKELDRVEGTLKEYKTVVFTAIPIIIILCAVVIYFVPIPVWRASMIVAILMLGIILFIDGLAHARIDDYQKSLLQAQHEFSALTEN